MINGKQYSLVLCSFNPLSVWLPALYVRVLFLWVGSIPSGTPELHGIWKNDALFGKAKSFWNSANLGIQLSILSFSARNKEQIQRP